MAMQHLLAGGGKGAWDSLTESCLSEKSNTNCEPRGMLTANSQIGMRWGENQFLHEGLILHFQKPVQGPGTKLGEDKSPLNELERNR